MKTDSKRTANPGSAQSVRVRVRLGKRTGRTETIRTTWLFENPVTTGPREQYSVRQSAGVGDGVPPTSDSRTDTLSAANRTKNGQQADSRFLPGRDLDFGPTSPGGKTIQNSTWRLLKPSPEHHGDGRQSARTSDVTATNRPGNSRFVHTNEGIFSGLASRFGEHPRQKRRRPGRRYAGLRDTPFDSVDGQVQPAAHLQQGPSCLQQVSKR